MATETPLKFIKATVTPTLWETDAVYFILNNGFAESYVTTSAGVPEKIGNTEMIEDVVENMPDIGQRFGIEDDEGFQDRQVDMTNFDFSILNADTILLQSNNGVNDHSIKITPTAAKIVSGATELDIATTDLIPVNVSELVNDANYLTVATLPPYPDSTSDLINDSGFITASSTNTLTNKAGLISMWTNNVGYITASSTDTFINKSGNITMWTNNAGYITASSSDTLTNKSGNISMWTNNVGYLTTAATSVSNSDSTLTISPTTGAVIASLNLAHANTWTQKQTLQLTTEQFRVAYDGSDYLTLVIGSTGNATFDLTGSSPQFTFSDLVNFPAGIDAILPEYTTTNPSTPSTGSKLFTRVRTGRRLLGQIKPTGVTDVLQSHFAFNRTQEYDTLVNNTTIQNFGIAALTIVGNSGAQTISASDYQSQTRRIEINSTGSTAPQVVSARCTQTQWMRGNASNIGGFYVVLKFGFSNLTATGHCFIGLNTGGAIAVNTAPSSLTNIIGVGKDSTDTTWQIIYNDGSGTATKTNTGSASFSTSAIFCARFFCFPNDSVVYVSLENLATGIVIYDDQISGDIPASTTLLAPILYASSSSTDGVIRLEFASMYAEFNG
jgi:hypothetical protein